VLELLRSSYKPHPLFVARLLLKSAQSGTEAQLREGGFRAKAATEAEESGEP